MCPRTIFHIDVNSAYLSWEAVDRLQKGEAIDLREIPSVVGGDIVTRHGIILAKSIPAKKYNIITGEPLVSALSKCPTLYVAPPRYELYMRCSNAMKEIVQKYSPSIQRYSVDEFFMDYTGMEEHFGDPIQGAKALSDEIYNTLGFTVNIGISTNKLLAKMASDFEKPNKVHTLYPGEIQEKMWPLPVEDLFMVGSATAKKLHQLGIHSIEQIAKADPKLLYAKLKSHGNLIWRFANGIEDSPVKPYAAPQKGIGNSTTLPFDATSKLEAYQVILSLVETIAMRMRDAHVLSQLISVSIKDHHFISASHQRKLSISTNHTTMIYRIACELFDELWRGEPIRHLGVHVSALVPDQYTQLSLLHPEQSEKQQKLDEAIDDIRLKYGSHAVIRATFLHSGIKPLCGGVIEDYPMMSSLL